MLYSAKTLVAGDPVQHDAEVIGNVVDTATVTTTPYLTSDKGSNSLKVEVQTTTVQFYAINYSQVLPVPLSVKPGDYVTIRITVPVVEGRWQSLDIEDYLPLPIFDSSVLTTPTISNPSSNPPTYPTWSFGPSDTFYLQTGIVPTLAVDGTINQVKFTYPTYDPIPTPTTTNPLSQVIDLLFTVQVTDEPYTNKLYMTNQAVSTVTGTSGSTSTQSTISQILLYQPVLVVQKGVIGADNPDKVFTPSNTGYPISPFTGDQATSTPIQSDVGGVDAGDILSFSITVVNQGNADAFDIFINDTKPAGFDYPGGNIANLNLKVK